MKTLKICSLILVSLFFDIKICFSQKKIETFYDLGRTKIKERYFVNAQNQKNGLYTKYDDRGIRGVEIPYTNGKPNGVAKEYYLPGYGFPGDERLKKSSTYVNGVQEGISVAYVYIKDGKEQLKEGVQTKAMEQYFHKDKLDREVQYFPNGKIAIDGYVTTGPHKEYYNNGTNKLIANLKDGTYEGAWKEWFENGNLALEGVKKDGVWFGEVKEYFENGKLKSKVVYGKRDYVGEVLLGKCEYYTEEGSLEKTMDYLPINADEQVINVIEYSSNRKASEYSLMIPERKAGSSPKTMYYGNFKVYTKMGDKLKSQGKYAHPKNSVGIWKEVRDSVWTWYKDDGSIEEESTYCGGKACGKWRLYYNDKWKQVESIENAAYYRDIEFSKDGGVNSEKVAYDYFITGEKQFEGKLLSINPDVLDGKCTFYHKNGKVESVVMYERGNVVKVIEAYDENGKKVKK
ncbi:MAG: hypothetical protein JSU07_03670 [Bacteroidetes bacterium]|nr:hypothetical protein [Bacteroidota bacterium]